MTQGIDAHLKLTSLRAVIFVLAAACGSPALPEEEEDLRVLAEANLMVGDDIKDFLMMDVCLDPDGKVMAGVSPLDRRCTRRRNVSANDPIPYHLHSHPAINCPKGVGQISKENVPVVQNATTRIVSTFDHGDDPGCPTGNGTTFGRFDKAADDGASISFFDSQFGFIMASNAQSDSYWVTPKYCEDNRTTSKRAFQGWVIGPRFLPSNKDPAGYGWFEASLRAGSPPEIETCGGYQSYFVSWVRRSFVYTGGAEIDSWVSNKYSAVHRDGTTPGNAQQFERTYWTKGLGLSRVEQWSRDDWKRRAREFGRKTGESGAFARAVQSARRHATSISAQYNSGTLVDDGLYQEAYVDFHGSERHLWYLTSCFDYTHVQGETGLYAVNFEAFVRQA
jgi:hypothetical protein